MILLLKMFWPKYFSFENHRLQSNWFQHYYMQWEPGSDFIDVPTCFFSFFANFFFENMDHLFRFLTFFFPLKITGYSRIGSNIITCGEGQEFIDVPTCEDKNECDAFQCDFKSTECENLPGSYHCKCRAGFSPNLECRPILDLGLADGGIPNDGMCFFFYYKNKKILR